MKRIVASLFFVVALFVCSTTAGPVQAAPVVTCTDLDGAYVLSQEFTPVYLGFFGSQFASESIMNPNGIYGSTWGTRSMRNSVSSYGNSFGTYSAFNSIASAPPAIYKNGILLGYVTVNAIIVGGLPLPVIDSNCVFFSTFPAVSTPPPSAPASVQASDGQFNDRVVVQWSSVVGAIAYVVGWAESPSGTPEFSDFLAGTSFSVTGLTPGVLYDFGVSAVNLSGNSAFTFDSGFVAQTEATNTPTPTATATPTQTPTLSKTPTPTRTVTPTPTSTQTFTPTSTPTTTATQTGTPSGTATPFKNFLPSVSGNSN